MKRSLRSTVAGLVVLGALLATAPSDAVGPGSRTAAQHSDGDGDGDGDAKIVGMAAPADLWSKRIKEVGRCGVEARRIYAWLAPDGKDQAKLIRRSVRAGMLPVISYKVRNVQTLIDGGYDTWLEKTSDFLDNLNVPVTATFWHEPYADLDPADFRAGSWRFVTRMQTTDISVGPILNGWLLDKKVPEFASFTSPSLLRKWDFIAVDSYQSGTAEAPGDLLPARAIPLLATWLDTQGLPDMPIGLGEYNGHTGAAIAAAGETILSTPELWFALAWNSTTDTYSPLAGDRLTEYQNTKADDRAKTEC